MAATTSSASRGIDDAERRLAVVGAVVGVDRAGGRRRSGPRRSTASLQRRASAPAGRSRSTALGVPSVAVPPSLARRSCRPRARASSRFSSSPRPGRERSGPQRAAARARACRRTASARSRTWSWKYSRCSRVSIAQQTWAEIAGAQWAEKGTLQRLADAVDAEHVGDAAEPGDVGLEDVDAAGELGEAGAGPTRTRRRRSPSRRGRARARRRRPSRSSELTGSSR